MNEIGQGMARQSERSQLAWELHVLEEASVNAFAMARGRRGLFGTLLDEVCHS